MRKLGRASEPAILRVKHLQRCFHNCINHLGREIVARSSKGFGLNQGALHQLCLLHHVAILLLVSVGNRQQDAFEAGAAIVVVRWEISSAVKRFAVSREKGSKRPASLPTDSAHCDLIPAINIGTLVAVYFDGDKAFIHDLRYFRIVNERFVAVKVDRDERPDIDSRYQVAVQAISGQGGWPLTAFLTPDGKPFYGGTYFPPGDNYGRPSFRRVLISISDAYREKNADVVEQAGMVEGAIAHSESFSGKTRDFSPQIIQEIVDSALKMFDQTHGGFGSAP